MQTENITAIILSAGYSSRMGDFKPLMQLGEMSVLERVILLFKDAGFSDIRAVTGYQADDLFPLLKRLGVQSIFNEYFSDGMFSSVTTAVNSLEQTVGAFMLLPVDIPLVRKQTISDLLQEYRQNRGKIFYPCFRGERGHPPLISNCFRDEIVCWNGPGGLRSLLEKYESEAVNVEIADENILFDIDTPDDYQKMLVKWQRYGIPTMEECEVILSKLQSPDKEKLIKHCRAVAGLAVFIAQELNETVCQSPAGHFEVTDISNCNRLDGILDLDLVIAAGLLHDLAKGQPNHAAAGAEILIRMGFPSVAEAVASHTDIIVSEDENVNFKEVVYLSDKLVQGDAVVLPEVRFEKMLDKYAGDPPVRSKIENRLQNAMYIKKKIEACTGRTLEVLMAKRAKMMSNSG